jgi:nucleotide-binding universal stress UspA family protein
MTHKVFIVPYDFTPVSENALQHAIATAKPVNARVYLLHVVAKHKEIEAAEAKLTKIVTKLNLDIEIIPSVRVGNIFDDIGYCFSFHNLFFYTKIQHSNINNKFILLNFC